MFELTEYQSETMAADEHSPPQAVDPRTRTTYVLLPLSSFMPTAGPASLAELLAGITPENLHAEWADGSPVGVELL